MSDESLVAQYSVSKKIDWISAGTEIVQATVGQTIEDGDYVGIVDGIAYPVKLAPLKLIAGVSTWAGRKVLKCASLVDHFVVVYGTTTAINCSLLKINTTGNFSVVGAGKSVVGTCSTLSTHNLYDACLLYGSDGTEYLCVVYKDASGYMSSTALQILSTGMQNAGTPEQVVTGTTLDRVRITPISSTVACIQALAQAGSTFLCSVNIISSKMSYATAPNNLAGTVLLGVTTDNKLVFAKARSVSSTAVYAFTYSTSTLDMTEIAAGAILTANIDAVGGGKFSSSTNAGYYRVGYDSVGRISIETLNFDQLTNTFTDGTVIPLDHEYAFRNTDGSIKTVTPALAELFIINDVVISQKFASWTEAGTVAMNGMHFITVKQTQSSLDTKVSCNLGNDPKCATLNTDLNVSAFITPFNPAWGILCANSIDYLFIATMLLCDQFGYAATGAAVDETIDIYVKGYIPSPRPRHVMAYGNGLVCETDTSAPVISSELDKVLFHLGSAKRGPGPKYLVKKIGSKIYLTGERIF